MSPEYIKTGRVGATVVAVDNPAAIELLVVAGAVVVVTAALVVVVEAAVVVATARVVVAAAPPPQAAKIAAREISAKTAAPARVRRRVDVSLLLLGCGGPRLTDVCLARSSTSGHSSVQSTRRPYRRSTRARARWSANQEPTGAGLVVRHSPAATKAKE